MALSNKERVGRVIDRVTEALVPFIIREYRKVHGKRYMDVIEQTLDTNAYGLPAAAKASDEALAKTLDAQSSFNLMLRHPQWRDIFQDKLGHIGRSYVSELYKARVDWAHQKPFSIDEAYRVADTARRLLEMISASKEAEEVNEIATTLLRMQFDAEAKKAKKVAQTEKAEEV
ncbi:MAG: hypothetical protein KDE51_26110, partial [Anaerolineales bacterium]|nr:hypothetical protein [Anaerolineales bacterium]